MATTMIPTPQPSPAPRPSPIANPGGSLRFVAVRANLMPDEVIDARRTDVVRRRVVIGLGALLVLILAGFASSWLQTSSSKGDLADQQHRIQALLDQQHDYAPLVAAQAQTAAINDKLTQLMVGDVRWQNMLATIRGDAPAGVGLTSVSSQITTSAAGNTAAAAGSAPIYSALNGTGKTPIGTLTIIGTANSKDQVAAYADKLAGETGLVTPVPTDFNSTSRPYTFTISAIVTSDALGGRYHVASVASVPTGAQGGN
jgi:hypothetical protein